MTSCRNTQRLERRHEQESTRTTPRRRAGVGGCVGSTLDSAEVKVNRIATWKLELKKLSTLIGRDWSGQDQQDRSLGYSSWHRCFAVQALLQCSLHAVGWQQRLPLVVPSPSHSSQSVFDCSNLSSISRLEQLPPRHERAANTPTSPLTDSSSLCSFQHVLLMSHIYGVCIIMRLPKRVRLIAVTLFPVSCEFLVAVNSTHMCSMSTARHVVGHFNAALVQSHPKSDRSC